MAIALLSTDLAVLSRVEGAAAKADKAVKSSSTAAQVAALCEADNIDDVVIDLAISSAEVTALVEQLQSHGTRRPRLIAFGPHVHEQKLAAARDAGCDVVLSRGQFFAQLDSILSG